MSRNPPSAPPVVSLRDSEKEKALKAGLTLRVYRLQERLRKLPLVPKHDWLRIERDRLVTELIEVARKDRCLSRVNPWAATD